jgi:hypothetical protein
MKCKLCSNPFLSFQIPFVFKLPEGEVYVHFGCMRLLKKNIQRGQVVTHVLMSKFSDA